MNAKIFSIFCNANSGAFASIETLTKVSIPKKWGIIGEVTKYTKKRVQIAYNYESAVNRHRVAEGKENDFKAESLPWGEWLVVNRVISHKGKTYYRVYDFPNNVDEQEYRIDGIKVSEEVMCVINAYLASKTHTSRQGVEKEVRPTTIDEDNIFYIKCGGEFRKDI